MAPYVPLYCKSNFSFLEGASHPEELVETCTSLGVETLALTDRDGVYGIVEAHVKARGDLWLRLETGTHIRGNFAMMRDHGIRTMFRGHDHFVAMRSIDSAGCLYAHDVVINEFAPGERQCKRRRARRDDGSALRVG